MATVRLKLKPKFDSSQLETGDLCLGFKQIDLLFNVGHFPGGGDCLIIKANNELMEVNSNDLIHDLDAYTKEII